MVGTRAVPVIRYRELSKGDIFVRQACIAFENKWELSVIWGMLTYSTNYHATPDEFTDQPETVEVAIISPDGDLWPHGDPHSYVGETKFWELYNYTMTQPSIPVASPEERGYEQEWHWSI